MLNRRHIAMNENIENIKPVHLDFISPTPAQAATHQMEITHVKLLNQFHPRITASWRAIPAPQHLIKINELPADHKKYTLPIVPNTDFIPARQGSGPAPSHCYDKPITDLKFVASITPTPWGLVTYDPEIKTPEQLIGKKIGLEPEGGSPRVLADAVLRDAWGIYDKVELKGCHPPQVMKGLLSGDFDATFWMQAWETLGGFDCSFPSLLEEKDAYWIGLSMEDIDRINKKNNWKMGRTLVPQGSIRVAGPKKDPAEDVGLPSFTGAICAWDDTEEEVVYSLVNFLDETSDLWPEFSGGCPLSLARMVRFPGLKEDMVHPGALKYYKEMNLEIAEPVQLRRMG
jgi:TRAP-type uncharacterized transport system substrate-binding protein